jgi:hypothetical protein
LAWIERATGRRDSHAVAAMSLREWNRFARRCGGVEAGARRVMTDMGIEEIRPDEARPGDVGVVLAPTHPVRVRVRPVCAIRTGLGWAATGGGGVAVAGFEPVAAWRIVDG